MNYDQPISQHWQLAPNGSGITQGADDIDLCIHNILSTRKGADVLRPEFGSKHFDYLDTPEDVFIPNVVREITLAIQTWEKALSWSVCNLKATHRTSRWLCCGA